MFPNIYSLADFRDKVSHKEEIREAVIDDDCISFCYMIGGNNTFDSAEVRECRGIVFSKSKDKIIGRPMHKVFNLGERADTQPHTVDWSKVVCVMDKRDGSMIHTVNHDGNIRLKTKKSFNSDVAVAVREWVASDSAEAHRIRALLSDSLLHYNTVIFEWTAPEQRIVLAYDKPELVLLQVRHNETGQYMDRALVKDLGKAYGVPVVDEVDEFFVDGEFDVSLMIEAAKTRTGIEGWVVQLDNGEMIKVKTEWYLARHKVMTFLRERDIAELVMNEQVDDFKSLLSSKGVDISEILDIENRVLEFFRNMAHDVDEAIAESAGLTAREMAEKYKQSKYSGLIMSKFNGKTPRFVEYFERNILKQEFSLRTLILKDVDGREIEN